MMKNRKIKVSLYTGAIQTMITGIVHFFIPYIWNWSIYTKDLPNSIEWGLYAINFFFSFLLVYFGGAILFMLIKNTWQNKLSQIINVGICLFWIVSFTYQSFNPFPLPQHYEIFSHVFWIVALVSAVLFLFPLYKLHKIKNHETH